MKTVAESSHEINQLVSQWEALCLTARTGEEFACLMGVLGGLENMLKAALSAVIEPPPTYNCEHRTYTGEVIYGIATDDPAHPGQYWLKPDGTSERFGYFVDKSTVVLCGRIRSAA